MTRKPPAASRVPQSRLGRLARLGLAAGELAVGGALQGLRRLGRGNEAEPMFSVATARRLVERLANLRGAAMKLGQLISLESEGLLPPELAQALESLRSQAAPMPLAQLRRVLGRAYGTGWEQRFARFDETPIASASIGQVHRARTIDGRELALKVQYPGVARSITSDVDNVATLLRLAQLLPLGVDVEEIAREAKRQLTQEADYLAEARFLEQYARLVADDPQIVLPKVHWDLTTARVMAMDYMDGVPLDSLGAETPQAVRDTLGSALQRLMFRELFEFRVMQTDPNFANYLYQPATARLVLLDFGATQQFSRAYTESYRRITRAIVAGDRPAIEREARRIGYIAADASQDVVDAAMEVLELVCEPLRSGGVYDYGASDLPRRARELGVDLAFKRGLLRMPPSHTMFLHRKLVGVYLLLARLGARVPTGQLLQPFLARRGAGDSG
ncbi:MAG TPA: AarF/ABC1/UbiB kinase family protein [Burkholderiaceae bacterium]|nr:AarF/ABC1/UbiB kinase family protein [Burkholderiaceae bacterium]